jgi:hypothetical protein
MHSMQNRLGKGAMEVKKKVGRKEKQRKESI